MSTRFMMASLPPTLSLLQNLFLNLGGVSKIDAVAEADIVGTGRIESLVHPVMAEVAFERQLFFVVKVNRLVGTFFDTTATPCALFLIEDDDPIPSLCDGLHRAGLGTGGLFAMLTDIDAPQEVEFPVHEFRAISPDRHVFDGMGRIDRIIFLFAGCFAGHASPAGILLDDQ
jgi:hypothetical protein